MPELRLLLYCYSALYCCDDLLNNCRNNEEQKPGEHLQQTNTWARVLISHHTDCHTASWYVLLLWYVCGRCCRVTTAVLLSYSTTRSTRGPAPDVDDDDNLHHLSLSSRD